MLTRPIYLHIRICRKICLKQIIKIFSFYYMSCKITAMCSEHIAVGMVFRS